VVAPRGTLEPDLPGSLGAPNAVRISAVTLRDFRNIARADLVLPAPGVVLVGMNGHGKTNVLEAMHYAHVLRSLRGARDADLVRFGAETLHLAIEAGGAACQRIAIGVERGVNRRKKIVVDGIQVPRIIDALGAVCSVVLSPRDVDLVSGSPAERRRFLDVALGATSPRYVTALQRYRAALLQRNAAIRDAAGIADGPARLAIWEPALADAGATLWTERLAWAEWAGLRMAELTERLGERAPVGLTLVRGTRDAELPGATDAALRESLAAALRRGRAGDLRRGSTQAGPHRDEIVLTLEGRLLRSFGSSGQQRCAAVALRLLERETVLRRTGRLPVMLLDDPFAELDHARARRILRLMDDGSAGQVVLAVPRPDDVPEEFTALERWEIQDGTVSA
jgi:DNA replication and repair protein RecF